jgi:DNA-binding GntR family transcriptional regulator
MKNSQSPTRGNSGKTASMGSVYDDILAAIIDQRAPPGTKLNELAMCKVFGISRRDMAQVLARLVFEGLAVNLPNRGAFVASPDANEARAIFAARKVIESGITELAAQRASGADYRALEQNIVEEHAARREGRMREAVRLSGRFHLLIAQIAGNPILTELVLQLVARTSLVTSLYENPNGLSCWHDDHGALVRLLRAHRARPAVELMRKHLDHLEESLNLEGKPRAKPDLRTIFRPTEFRNGG